MMSKEKKKAKISKAIIYALLVLMEIIYIILSDYLDTG